MQGVHSVQITLLSHASLSAWGWGGNGRGLFTGGDGRIPWALTQYFSRVLSKQLENGSLSHLANPSTPGDPRNGQLTERVHACSFSLGETVPRLPSATNQEHVTLSGLDPENWHLLPYPGSLSPLAPRIKSKLGKEQRVCLALLFALWVSMAQVNLLLANAFTQSPFPIRPGFCWALLCNPSAIH